MIPDSLLRDDLEALLRWYVDMAAAAAGDPPPPERSAPARAAGADPAAAPRQPAEPIPRQASAIPPAPPLPGLRAAALSVDGAVRSAREAAERAETLDDLRAVLESFEGCGLRFTATQLAFADGNPAGRVMAVGEAPGAEEDRQGRPFSGPSGRLLDRMLGAIGLGRTDVYIANVVPWRPPGNRTPTPQEVATCRPFIARQIALADPDVLLLLGGPAAQSLLGVKDGIMRLRGRWHDYDTGRRVIRALPSLHPAYLLRQPAHKRLAWADLRALRKALDAGKSPDAP